MFEGDSVCVGEADTLRVWLGDSVDVAVRLLVCTCDGVVVVLAVGVAVVLIVLGTDPVIEDVHVDDCEDEGVWLGENENEDVWLGVRLCPSVVAQSRTTTASHQPRDVARRRDLI